MATWDINMTAQQTQKAADEILDHLDKPEYVVTETGTGENTRRRANIGETVHKYFQLYRKEMRDHAATRRHAVEDAEQHLKILTDRTRDAQLIRDSRRKERSSLTFARTILREMSEQWWFPLLPYTTKQNVRDFLTDVDALL